MKPQSLAEVIFNAWAKAREMLQDADDNDTTYAPVADGNEAVEEEQ